MQELALVAGRSLAKGTTGAGLTLDDAPVAGTQLRSRRLEGTRGRLNTRVATGVMDSLGAPAPEKGGGGKTIMVEAVQKLLGGSRVPRHWERRVERVGRPERGKRGLVIPRRRGHKAGGNPILHIPSQGDSVPALDRILAGSNRIGPGRGTSDLLGGEIGALVVDKHPHDPVDEVLLFNHCVYA